MSFFASSLSQVGSIEFELTGDQINHSDEIAGRSITASSGFGCLDETVNAFKQTVGDAGCEPAQNTIPVPANRAPSIDHGLDAAAGSPTAPLLQECFGERLRLTIEILKDQFEMKGPSGLHARLAKQKFRGELELIVVHCVRVPQQRIPPALELRILVALGPARLVQSIADDLGDMELVESDRGIRQELTDSLDKGGRHIGARLLDRLRIAAVKEQI